MEKRLCPKTGWQVHPLAFGCMRFHNQETAIRAVHRAIERGVNYFDVAPLYGAGTAELWLGQALQGRRMQTIVTAKSSPGNGGPQVAEHDPENGFGICTGEEAHHQIRRSMKILGIQHLDMYHFWACHGDPVFQEAVKPGGFLEGVLEAREEGLFDYIGMTTHADSNDIIRYISDSPYEFDMVTLPFHPGDPSRLRAIKWCAERGIGVIAMNPLGGGRLARRAATLDAIAERCGSANMVEAALRFVAYTPGVTAALNGITYADHVDTGIDALEMGPLTEEQRETLINSVQELEGPTAHICTGCAYCGMCPEGILIPEVLDIAQNLRVKAFTEEARARLKVLMKEKPGGYDPRRCTGCGACASRCPNHIPVSDLMEQAAELWRTEIGGQDAHGRTLD